MGDEYIKKEDAIQSIIAHDIVGVDARGWAEYLLKNAPTIDAVPVVRCKDCKHFKIQTENTGVCDGGFFHVPVHVAVIDFCPYGERKDYEDDRR